MSCEVKVNVKLDPQFINMLTEDIKKAAMLTMADAKDDVTNSQTVPFDNGPLQNDAFVVNIPDAYFIKVCLVYGEPYARYQFFGMTRDGKPLNYQKVNNPYARSHWLEPYMDGVFLTEHFNNNLKKVREGG